MARRTVQSRLWKQAQKRAERQGRGGDIAYVTRIYKLIGGKFKATNPLDKIGIYSSGVSTTPKKQIPISDETHTLDATGSSGKGDK